MPKALAPTEELSLNSTTVHGQNDEETGKIRNTKNVSSWQGWGQMQPRPSNRGLGVTEQPGASPGLPPPPPGALPPSPQPAPSLFCPELACVIQVPLRVPTNEPSPGIGGCCPPAASIIRLCLPFPPSGTQRSSSATRLAVPQLRERPPPHGEGHPPGPRGPRAEGGRASGALHI